VLIVALGIFFGQKVIHPIVASIMALWFGVPDLASSEAFGWIVSIATAVVLYLFLEFALFKIRREGFVA
jgi:hypothetical protein